MADKVSLDESIDRITDGDRVRLSASLDPRGDIERLPQGKLFLMAAATHRSDHHEPRMDPHAYGETHPFLLFQANIQSLHHLKHAQASSHRPLGIIFMGLG